jgi:general secretion pathway protein G
MFKQKKAFTLIELLVVIAIIGILATLAVVALQQARSRARDSKRLADVKQMQTALELFFNEHNRYPTEEEWNSGQIAGVSDIYMQAIPAAPAVADGSCTGDQNSYTYQPQNNNRTYLLSFCLGKDANNLDSGPKCLTPGGVLSQDCGIEGGDDGGGDSTENDCLVDSSGCIWQTYSSPVLSEYGCSSNLDVYNNELYASYRDGSESRYLKIAKVNETSVEPLGGRIDGPLNSSGDSTMQIFNGIPYISYKDRGDTDMIITKKFVGGIWESLGESTSFDAACHPSLAVYDNIPYVAYRDEISTEAYVVKFVNSAWEQVGPTVSNGQKGSRPILRIHNGELYVMYLGGCDDSLPKWIVKKFDGSAWNLVGAPIEILHTERYVHSDFQISNNGDLYVVYQGGVDVASGGVGERGVALKFNGTSWQPLGPNDGVFSVGHASQLDLYIYNEVPYVAYKNGSSVSATNPATNPGLVEVKRFNGSSWENVGPIASYSETFSNISMLIDNNTIYLMFLEDQSPDNENMSALVIRKLVFDSEDEGGEGPIIQETECTDLDKIGDSCGGGIVFYKEYPGVGETKIFVAATSDQSSGVSWGCDGVLIGASSSTDGKNNTLAIMSHPCGGSSAAEIASDYQGGGYDDWYLPSSNELNYLLTNLSIYDSYYWSSTELDTASAVAGIRPSYSFKFINEAKAIPKAPPEYYKGSSNKVRAIRSTIVGSILK